MDTSAGARNRRPRTQCHALSHTGKRSDKCIVAIKIECTVAYAAGQGRPLAAHAARIAHSSDARVAARAASHANALEATHVQARPARVLARDSYKRVDTYVVERPVTRPATGNARGLKCALADATVAASAALQRPRGHTCADARNTRPCTRCLSSVLTHASSLSQSNAPLTRTATGSARVLNLALSRVCGRNAVARAASHANAFAATHAGARNTRPRTHCLPSGRTHTLSLSTSNARWLTRPATGSARGLSRARHAPSHAMSHERADTYVIARKSHAL